MIQWIRWIQRQSIGENSNISSIVIFYYFGLVSIISFFILVNSGAIHKQVHTRWCNHIGQRWPHWRMPLTENYPLKWKFTSHKSETNTTIEFSQSNLGKTQLCPHPNDKTNINAKKSEWDWQVKLIIAKNQWKILAITQSKWTLIKGPFVLGDSDADFWRYQHVVSDGHIVTNVTVQPYSGGRQHMILPNFAKKCMKLRKFWAVRGGAPGVLPPKSATGQVRTDPKCIFKQHTVLHMYNIYVPHS